MERELWRVIRSGLRRVPRWWPRNASYSNREILAVLLWAALHNKPICWACLRSSWPLQAWRRRLPDQSTMSRRLRDPDVWGDLRRLIDEVQRDLGVTGTLVVDGKPLPVSNVSGDPDAARGWGAGIYARGYKLHAIIDRSRRLIDFDVRPLNAAESEVAASMAAGLRVRAGVMLADASYDSNRLYAACESRGIQLLAPRKKPGTSISRVSRNAPSRIRSIEILEGTNRGPARLHDRKRRSIERFFGTLATPSTGLYALPPWVRRTTRVRHWVAAKLAINAARIAIAA